MATIQKKSFWQQYGGLILILGGIAIGALIGAFAPSVGTTIKPIGDIFLNLLFTIVVPLVFVSIASAVGSMANMKRCAGSGTSRWWRCATAIWRRRSKKRGSSM